MDDIIPMMSCLLCITMATQVPPNAAKWVQMVHLLLQRTLADTNAIVTPFQKVKQNKKQKLNFAKLADHDVTVESRLKEVYSSYLQRCKTDQEVLSITPGLFQREFGDLTQTHNEHAEFKVLLFGTGDDEDFELKGYNIAAQAFSDQRLKNKPYHLIFVGAPEGKQEDVREKLLRYCIAEAQLIVRKFVQSREKLTDLLCEADLAIMPSKTEEFGLVAVEDLSAGLPILVGSKSGMAKALENGPHGNTTCTCIVCSDDPAEWAKAIEGVRCRHQIQLEEVKTLKSCYGEVYIWKEQCKAPVESMWKMVYDKSCC